MKVAEIEKQEYCVSVILYVFVNPEYSVPSINIKNLKRKKRKGLLEEDGEGRVSLHLFSALTSIAYPKYINFSVQSPSR